VLDELRRDAKGELVNRELIARQRAQDAMCATREGGGAIRDFEAVLVVLSAI
jgi:hypothetical protein